MKWKRKMARKNLPKKYKCCGSEMLYNESYGVYAWRGETTSYDACDIAKWKYAKLAESEEE